MSSATHLIAIDWGTSSLRGALMAADGKVLEHTSSAEGVLKVGPGQFGEVFARMFGAWLDRVPGCAVLASGMVGSRQGWVEAPYVSCPAGFADIAAAIVHVDAGKLGQVHITPGLKFEVAGEAPDVMRGEETQILGAMAALKRGDGLIVLPGTHSKWAQVEAGHIVSFATYMTGELYGMLCQHSILGRLMPSPAPDTFAQDELNQAAFERGVAVSYYSPGAGRVLHTLFSVRTLGLFGEIAAADLASYLSGLLIGEEIRCALKVVDGGEANARPISIVGRGDLAMRYRLAFHMIEKPSVVVEDAVTFRGLHALARAAGLIS